MAPRSLRCGLRTVVMRTRQGMPGRMRGSSHNTTFGARLPPRCVARKRKPESATPLGENGVAHTEPILRSSPVHFSAIALPPGKSEEGSTKTHKGARRKTRKSKKGRKGNDVSLCVFAFLRAPSCVFVDPSSAAAQGLLHQPRDHRAEAAHARGHV